MALKTSIENYVKETGRKNNVKWKDYATSCWRDNEKMLNLLT